MEDGNYKEAYDGLSSCFDEYESANPFYRYLRAKCCYNLGTDYLNIAREDIYKASKQLSRISKMNAYIMQAKVEYIAALIEYNFGSDLKRALWHFKTFIDL